MNRPDNNYFTAGVPVAEAKNALVLIHGRGGTAADIAALAQEFILPHTAVFAPQATNKSWYPHSFLAAETQNQPALDVALATIDALIADLMATGISAENIYLAGFSQGACLTLEYSSRNAKTYGGVVAFTGGLIGDRLETSRYKGDFNGTPILITTGNPDTHVPLSRVEASVKILEKLGASVTLEVFAGRPHTIIPPEIQLAQKLVFNRIANLK
ncbi:MAG: phospholipase [Sphingobacteriaceae bacterium]|nr:MAG: phospholipase [Sphingobacteriaceae bacterium]